MRASRTAKCGWIHIDTENVMKMNMFATPPPAIACNPLARALPELWLWNVSEFYAKSHTFGTTAARSSGYLTN